jgi:hypothetical protein
MQIAEAVRRFASWPNRGDLNCVATAIDGSDVWPHAAAAACMLAGMLESASTDDDLRAAMTTFAENHIRLADAYRAPTWPPKTGWPGATLQAMRAVDHPAAHHPRRPAFPLIEHYELGIVRRVVRITPQMAIWFYGLDELVARYARRMAAGEWQPSMPNSDEITIIQHVESGELRCLIGNGNHRLMAIALAGCPIEMKVAAPREVFTLIDQWERDA